MSVLLCPSSLWLVKATMVGSNKSALPFAAQPCSPAGHLIFCRRSLPFRRRVMTKRQLLSITFSIALASLACFALFDLGRANSEASARPNHAQSYVDFAGGVPAQPISLHLNNPSGGP